MSTDLGRRIRSRREELGSSRQEVARRAGIDPGYLGYLEEGPARPSLGALVSIADVLGVSLPSLLGEDDASSDSGPGLGAGDRSPAPGANVHPEEIPVSECLGLLAGRSVGRLAVVIDGHPLIFPVNYRVHGDTVVFRTGPGTKLEGSALRRVAFEVDDVNADEGTGWSVVVQGHGYDISHAVDARSTELRTLPVVPFAPGARRHWIMITPVVISGRRLTKTPEGVRRRHASMG